MNRTKPILSSLRGALLLSCCVIWVSNCNAAHRKNPLVCAGANVILISIDTLRADHLGCYGYSRGTSPRLDALAANSFVFERCYAHSPNTIISHASMLTSLYPVSHGVRPDIPINKTVTTFAEVFQAAGYRTAGFTTHRIWLNGKMGFAQGFDYFQSTGQSAKEVNRDAVFWLRSIKLQSPKKDETPFLLFVHYYDVHADWHELPYETKTTFDDKFVDDYSGEFRGCRAGECASHFLSTVGDNPTLLSREELEWVEARYDGGIAYTDHKIGTLLDQIREEGYFDNSWIVITADHGEEFMEHGKLLHTQPYEETARVPLIIKPPNGRTTRAVSDVVGLVDLMPTLMEGVGIQATVDLQGRSFLPTMADDPFPQEAVFFNEFSTPENITVRRGNYTLVARGDFTELELYDHTVDQGQKNNITEEHLELAQNLRDRAMLFHKHQLDYHRERGLARDVQPVTLTEEEIERLRSLGYVFH